MTDSEHERALKTLEKFTDWYVLDDAGEPVRANLRRWVEWSSAHPERKQLARDQVGDILISTVFLGLDHGHEVTQPVLWETMIFGGQLDEAQERYLSRQEALAGHARWLALVRETPN